MPCPIKTFSLKAPLLPRIPEFLYIDIPECPNAEFLLPANCAQTELQAFGEKVRIEKDNNQGKDMEF